MSDTTKTEFEQAIDDLYEANENPSYLVSYTLIRTDIKGVIIIADIDHDREPTLEILSRVRYMKIWRKWKKACEAGDFNDENGDLDELAIYELKYSEAAI